MKNLGLYYVCYGIYCLIVSLGGLFSLKGKSKTAVIIWGVLNIPVMLLASVFMFCVKPQDLG